MVHLMLGCHLGEGPSIPYAGVHQRAAEDCKQVGKQDRKMRPPYQKPHQAKVPEERDNSTAGVAEDCAILTRE